MENTKSISAFFSENLNAPLTNVQWSWGADNDKGVYLRIWADEVKDNKNAVFYYRPSDKRLGQKERHQHIQSIKQGKPGYVVLITDGHQSPGGTWRIGSYDECVYRISGLSDEDSGDVYADIDFENPIYPNEIGNEIDLKGIVAAANKVKTSGERLEKAITQFKWKPTGICPLNDEISLMSSDGKLTATLVISKNEWIRN